MNPRTTGILLLVTAALGAFVWFYEIEGGDQRAEAEAAGKRLFPDVEQEMITALELQTTDRASARLERVDQVWSLVEPLAFPADGFAADGLASNLAGLASEDVLEDPQGPEEYGLGDGARVVRFQAGKEYALRLGNATPLGSNSYAQVEGSEQIVTVATFRKQSFEKSLLDLRERRILDFDTNAVTRIEARWPGGEVALVRSAPAEDAEGEADAEAAADAPEARWRLSSPLDARADDEGVNRLLSDLAFLRAEGFVDEPPEEVLAGFEDPAYEIVLHGEAVADGAPKSWRFAVGGLHEGDKRLVRAAQPSLYTIPVERLHDFPREVVGYRFKQLASFPVGDVSQVDFFFHPKEGDPVAITAERGDDGWTSGPERLAPGKVARIVSELAALEAGDILSEDASEQELEALGLAPPNTIVSIFGAGPDGESTGEGAETALPRLAEIHLGNVEGSEWILARAAGDSTVYRLGYELAEHVPLSLDALRNRFLAEGEPEVAEPAEPPAGGLEELLSPSEESP